MSKINIKVPIKDKERRGREEDFENYPYTDEPLGSPATLEISFYNLFTRETSPGSGEYEDLDIETEAEPVVERTVTLDKGIWMTRQQTDHFKYYRNTLELSAQFYEDHFGPSDANRFNCEPLEPIITEDPNTDPPNIKDRDTNMRWDGVGVKTPIFHVDLIRDVSKAYSTTSYKKGRIERMVNYDLKKGVSDFTSQGFDLPKKYSSIKIKKTKPLTYVIDSIWVDKAHLSIEEIESASNYVTSLPNLTFDTETETITGYNEMWSIDAVEGIFYNKFDTFLCKDREAKTGGGTVTKKYKITTEPRYSADAIEKPILEFYSGGIVKVKAYMVPRNWWYYARFYSPGAIEELGPAIDGDNRNGLKTAIYSYYGEEPDYTFYWDSYIKSALRDPISNYTTIFSLWSTPPHDYRLPVRDDTLVPIWDGEIPPSEYPKIYVSWIGGFTGYREFEPEGTDPTAYYGIVWTGGNPLWSSDHQGTAEDELDDMTIRPLNDMGFVDINTAPYGRETIGSRGNGTKGYTEYIDSKYGFFENGMRGLFLYNFSAVPWTSSDMKWYYYGIYGNSCRTPLDRATEAEPWLWYLKTDEIIIVPCHFAFYHKTPTGCIWHASTRNWYNKNLGVYYLRSNAGSYVGFPGAGQAGGPQQNIDYQLLYSCTYTPPDGGVWKSNTDVEAILCGIQYPDATPETVAQTWSFVFQEPGNVHNLWPQTNKYPYDGKDLYDSNDIVMFGKFWTKFTDSNLYRNNSASIDAGTYPSDNIPFMIGIAGAKAESLVAILDVDGKIYYIWREEDEEEDLEYDGRPLLPINAATNMTWTEGSHTVVEFHPPYGCGEIYNQYTKFGNIKTLYDSGTLTRVYPLERPCDYRIAIEMVHQDVEWYDTMISVNEEAAKNPGYLGSSEAYDADCYPWQNIGEHYDRGPLNASSYGNVNYKDITQETLWEFEMPIYIMTYREVALHDTGPQATRWCGSFNKLRDGTIFVVSAADRNRDSCGT